MPLFRRTPTPTLPAPPPAEWLPQQFGRRGFRAVADPIIEPCWRGVRVIARLASGKVSFVDDEGVDCTEEFATVAEAVAAAALADELILDGHLTVEATQETVGVDLPTVETPTAPQVMAQMMVGSRRKREAEPTPPRDPNRPIAFVAVDLLSIDGSPLIDLPLLERKRLLDGSLRTGEIVRISPFVRPPADSFVNTWQAQGFFELAYKGANSRYLPGAPNEDWAAVVIPKR